MIKSRLALQTRLEAILGSKNVYFQPPANVQMKYPCIVYSLYDLRDKTADNKKYMRNYMYKVTLIHRDPDNKIVDRLMDLRYCDFDNSFNNQGLIHYVFTLYYKNEKEIN